MSLHFRFNLVTMGLVGLLSRDGRFAVDQPDQGACFMLLSLFRIASRSVPPPPPIDHHIPCGLLAVAVMLCIKGF